eukprot:gene20369-biopygen14626
MPAPRPRHCSVPPGKLYVSRPKMDDPRTPLTSVHSSHPSTPRQLPANPPKIQIRAKVWQHIRQLCQRVHPVVPQPCAPFPERHLKFHHPGHLPSGAPLPSAEPRAARAGAGAERRVPVAPPRARHRAGRVRRHR